MNGARCAPPKAETDTGRTLDTKTPSSVPILLEFGLNMTDEEIRTCIEVMERKGEKGAPHPFFAHRERRLTLIDQGSLRRREA